MQLKYNKLFIYEVDNNYIKYLCEFDNNVRQKSERKYTGILIHNNNMDYCIPLTCKVKKRSPKLTINIKDGNKIISQLTLNNMIPVNDKAIKIVDVKKDKDKDYLNKEIQYLRKDYVKKAILEKAENIMRIIHNCKDRDYDFFRTLCVNYDLLETKFKKYENKNL